MIRPKDPVISAAIISKIKWKNKPMNKAERKATIWLLVILLAKRPMLVYAALISIKAK
jgi:hypothetical protein